ncbi:GMC oxidoreductase [Phlyctema vagabunda]|uniref:GMC oxidoreductase n=1 Tax=Phlyctema vagabunda TaxID=108571 RepID=A0ABR4P1P0_9HELO
MTNLLLLAVFFTLAQARSIYDYVIIGGGTAGLTIAARLTEDPNVSVIVLEAGNDHSNDTVVLSPALYTIMYGNQEYDWNFHTVPQVYANGQIIAHPRGKQLGGSSAMNFLFWTHTSQQDLNNWGILGNANWSWSSVDPCFKKSEAYVTPTAQIKEGLLTTIDGSLHGDNGAIKNTFPDRYGLLDKAWPRTFEKMGLAVDSDPRNGLALGDYTNLLNLNLTKKSRSYAATAYYLPAAKRPNFKILTGAHVQKILFNDPKTGGENVVTANGVQYSVGSIALKVHARKEVILSAGAIGSPQILELSGIGNPEILVLSGIETLDDFKNSAYFDKAYAEYLANATGPLSSTGASSGLLSCPQIGCSDLNPPVDFSHLPLGLADQYKIISENFHTEAIAQELTVSGGMSPQYVNDTTKLFTTNLDGNFFSILGVLEHPYSR